MWHAYNSAKRSQNNPIKKYNHWSVYVAASLAIFLAKSVYLGNTEQFLGYGVYNVPSKAMEPTINCGDKITTGMEKDELIDYGNIVVLLTPDEKRELTIKRVIGLPGDRVTINNGKVSINDKILDENYILKEDIQDVESDSSIDLVVPQEYIYVLGDNRLHSRDSRNYGPVPLFNIVNKVRYINYGVACDTYNFDIDRVGKSVL